VPGIEPRTVFRKFQVFAESQREAEQSIAQPGAAGCARRLSARATEWNEATARGAGASNRIDISGGCQ
jgi:hypothetical protein